MAGFDRSKLKATTAAALQSKQQEQEAKRPSSGGSAGYHEIKAGDNKFRLFPFHPDSGIDTYAVPVTVSYLSVTKPKRDDNGRVVEGVTEVKRSRVFNGKVHGNLPKDLVEEYMTVAKKVAISAFVEGRSDAKAIADKIWAIMTSYASPQSIKPSDCWTVYAVKEEGRDKDGNSIWSSPKFLDLKKTVCEQLTQKAIEFSGDTMSPDIYTDADEGVCVIINKSGEKKETKYTVSLDTVKTKQGNQLVSMSVPTPLTDAQIDAWLKLASLAKTFVGTYRAKELQYQIEGLQNFDAYLATQGYPINVFSYEEFVSSVNEIIDLVPDDEDGAADAPDAGGADDSANAEEEVTAEQAAPAPVVKQEPAKPVSRPTATAPIKAPPIKTVQKAVAPVLAPKPTTTLAPAATAVADGDRVARIKAMMGKK